MIVVRFKVQCQPERTEDVAGATRVDNLRGRLGGVPGRLTAGEVE